MFNHKILPLLASKDYIKKEIGTWLYIDVDDGAPNSHRGRNAIHCMFMPLLHVAVS